VGNPQPIGYPQRTILLVGFSTAIFHWPIPYERDDLVDSLNDQIFRELITYTVTDPSTSERVLHLVIVSRYLERIAGHATNIKGFARGK